MRSKYAVLANVLEERLAALHLDSLQISGCSTAELKEIVARQHVDHLPQMYAEFMVRVGKTKGFEWHFGSEIAYPAILEFKEQTFEVLHKPDIFVLTHDSQGDCALYFQVTDDDPVVYWMGYESSLVVKEIGLLSNFLIDWVAEIEEFALR